MSRRGIAGKAGIANLPDIKALLNSSLAQVLLLLTAASLKLNRPKANSTEKDLSESHALLWKDSTKNINHDRPAAAAALQGA